MLDQQPFAPTSTLPTWARRRPARPLVRPAGSIGQGPAVDAAWARLAARHRLRVAAIYGLVNPLEAADQALLRGDSPDLEVDDLEACLG